MDKREKEKERVTNEQTIQRSWNGSILKNSRIILTCRLDQINQTINIILVTPIDRFIWHRRRESDDYYR